MATNGSKKLITENEVITIELTGEKFVPSEVIEIPKKSSTKVLESAVKFANSTKNKVIPQREANKR